MDILSLNVLLGMPLPLCSLKMFEVAGGNPLCDHLLHVGLGVLLGHDVDGGRKLHVAADMVGVCVGIDQSDDRLVSQFLNLVENRLAPARILRVHHGDAIGHDEYRSIAATPFEYE